MVRVEPRYQNYCTVWKLYSFIVMFCPTLDHCNIGSAIYLAFSLLWELIFFDNFLQSALLYFLWVGSSNPKVTNRSDFLPRSLARCRFNVIAFKTFPPEGVSFIGSTWLWASVRLKGHLLVEQILDILLLSPDLLSRLVIGFLCYLFWSIVLEKSNDQKNDFLMVRLNFRRATYRSRTTYSSLEWKNSPWSR